MNQRIIDVVLTTLGEDRDVLRFYIDNDECIDIDLDNASCQTEIKKIFSEILQIAVNEDIEFNYICEEQFPRELYKDVCEEYIKDISEELQSVIAIIRQ